MTPSPLFYIYSAVIGTVLSMTIGSGSVIAEDSPAVENPKAKESTVPHQLRYPKAIAKIESQGRSFDPFGIDMNAKGAMIQMDAVEVALEPDAAPDTGSMLQVAMEKLSVTGIMPGSQSIMIAGRFISVGQVLTLSHDGILFRLRLDRVHSTHLDFSDLETNETVKHALNILPTGSAGIMKYGTRMIGLPSGAQPLNGRILIE